MLLEISEYIVYIMTNLHFFRVVSYIAKIMHIADRPKMGKPVYHHEHNRFVSEPANSTKTSSTWLYKRALCLCCCRHHHNDDATWRHDWLRHVLQPVSLDPSFHRRRCVHSWKETRPKKTRCPIPMTSEDTVAPTTVLTVISLIIQIRKIQMTPQ